MSQRKLATAIQLSPGAVSNYLSGGRTLPRAEELLALARYFGVSVEWLLGEDGGSSSDHDHKLAPSPLKPHPKAAELRAVVRQLKRLVARLEDFLGDS